jgi:hypothetical protein
MKSRTAIAALIAVLVSGVLVSSLLLGQTQQRVAFPEGYRNWTHVKSAVILEGHVNYNAFGGVHHVYANDEAITALKDGRRQRRHRRISQGDRGDGKRPRTLC